MPACNRKSDEVTVRLFFASDLHGSETCFRKFVNAARSYRVDWLLMGGDMSGKQLVPLVRASGRWTARFQGAAFEAETDADLAGLEKRLADAGAYPLRTEPDFVERLRGDQALVEETLHRLIFERVERWVAFAQERLGSSKSRCLLGLGNDDAGDLAQLFTGGPVMYAADGVLPIDGFYLASLGWSNPTPWHTQRECSETDLETKLQALVASPDAARTIFNVHVPPYDSGLDTAARLDDNLTIQLVGGQPDMVPVGSTAVASAIRAFHPLLSLHGHVHESRGIVKWGSTTLVNPGSEYDQGVLLGAVIEVQPGKVRQCQLVAG
jgi:Icc-related predicted phosphoesterase